MITSHGVKDPVTFNREMAALSNGHTSPYRGIDPNVHTAIVQESNALLWASIWLGGAMLFWSAYWLR